MRIVHLCCRLYTDADAQWAYRERTCAENYNNSQNEFIFKAAIIIILIISNHNNFRLLFDKLLPYILFEKYIYIFSSEMASPREPALGQLYRHTISFPTAMVVSRTSTVANSLLSTYTQNSITLLCCSGGWLGSRVVSVLDSSAEGPGFKSQSRRCRVTVLGKLFAPIVPLLTKQQNW